MSISDKVAILGMGCCHFGERWDAGPEDLAIEAFKEALQDAGVEVEQIEAAWLGAGNPDLGMGRSGLGISNALELNNIAQHNFNRNDLKRAMSRVSVKSHAGGSRNPKAHLRFPITEEQVMKAPLIAEPLGLFDCCGVSDGSACAIVTTPATARSMGKKDMVSIKSVQLAASNGSELESRDWNGASFSTVRTAAARAYKEAGISDPRQEFHLTEVHDCFSITELVLMEELGLSDEGRAAFDILDRLYDADGKIPCQTDGGPKCFGHPIGASGLRMIYEIYLQLLGRAGGRQLSGVTTGQTHNLGGSPPSNVTSVIILGLSA